MGRPKGSKDSKPRVRRTKAQIEAAKVTETPAPVEGKVEG